MRFLWLFLLVTSGLSAISYVHDETGFFTKDEAQALSDQIEAHGGLVYVATTATTGYKRSLEAYAKMVGQDVQRDPGYSGIESVIAILPGEKRLWISIRRPRVGGFVDSDSKRIIDEVLTPGFRGGQAAQALAEAVSMMKPGLVKNRELASVSPPVVEQPAPSSELSQEMKAFGSLLAMLFVVFLGFLAVALLIAALVWAWGKHQEIEATMKRLLIWFKDGGGPAILGLAGRSAEISRAAKELCEGFPALEELSVQRAFVRKHAGELESLERRAGGILREEQEERERSARAEQRLVEAKGVLALLQEKRDQLDHRSRSRLEEVERRCYSDNTLNTILLVQNLAYLNAATASLGSAAEPMREESDRHKPSHESASVTEVASISVSTDSSGPSDSGSSDPGGSWGGGEGGSW